MKPKQSFDFKIALSNVRELIFHIERIARDDDEFVAPTIPHIRLSADPFVAGEKERKRIGVDIREQLDWATKDAFRKWRVAVENTGIFVFQQKFPLGDCRGFTLFDTDMAPVIVVNKDETFDVAKVFTLIHEMCHLLLRAPGIPSYNERDPLEAFCNKFTAAFFMPLDALRAVLPCWPNEPVNWKRDEIASWARRLKVSQMALALRLEQLGLATSGFHRKFEYKGKTAAIPHQGGPPRVVVRMSEIGVSYSKVVIDALNRQAINEVEAVEALGLGPGHLDAVKASLTRVRRQAVLG